MKRLNFYLLLIVLGSHSAWAQCSNDDYECWMTEIVHQIENQNFKTNGKPFRRTKKKDTPTEIRNAAASLRKTRIKSFYKPLSELKKTVIDKQATKFYKDALTALRKGESKATQNLKMTNRFTEAMDNTYLTFFQERIPQVEQERDAALVEALETAQSAFEGGEYPKSAKNFEFFVRESEDNNPDRSVAQEKLRQSRYYINYDLASNAYDKGKYEAALTFIQKAISYWDDPTALNLQQDIALAGYQQMVRTAGGKEESNDYKEAIKLYEKARKFYNLADKTSLPDDAGLSPDEYISEAKNTAAKHLMNEADLAHENGRPKQALEKLNASKEFGNVIYTDENDNQFSAGDLLNKFYEEKKDLGETEYNKGNYDVSLKAFKAAGVYKDKDLMENNLLFVQAVKEAVRLEENSGFQTSAHEKDRLATAWAKADSLGKGITFTSNLNTAQKYDGAADNYRSAASLEKRDSQTHIQAEIRPLPLDSRAVPIRLKNTRDDSGFGGDARITAYIEYRKNPGYNEKHKLQAKIFIKMVECCHHSFSGGDTVWEIESDPINIAEIPQEFRERFVINGFYNSNYRNKQFLIWEGKKLDNLEVRRLPNVLRLRVDSDWIVGVKLYEEKGWKFDFDTSSFRTTLYNAGK